MPSVSEDLLAPGNGGLLDATGFAQDVVSAFLSSLVLLRLVFRVLFLVMDEPGCHPSYI